MKTVNVNVNSPTSALTPLIPAGTVMNATINSNPMQLEGVMMFSIQIVFTGTPTGTWKLQASDDPVSASNAVFGRSSLNLPVNWTDITNSTFSVAAAGSVMWDYSWPGFTWVRAVYTDTSGGTSTAIVTVATFNGKAE